MKNELSFFILNYHGDKRRIVSQSQSHLILFTGAFIFLTLWFPPCSPIMRYQAKFHFEVKSGYGLSHSCFVSTLDMSPSVSGREHLSHSADSLCEVQSIGRRV